MLLAGTACVVCATVAKVSIIFGSRKFPEVVRGSFGHIISDFNIR